MSSRLALGLLLTAACSTASVAHAHIALMSPTPRTTSQKDGPCGAPGSVRGATAAVFEPGARITLRWRETVDHTAHYRVAFDADGDDDFVPPAGRDDLYNSPSVLLDAIADANGGDYSAEVTLPDVECERCTLQLIQVMYGAGNYFQCADIAIRRSGEPPPVGTDAGTPPPPGVDAGTPSAPDDAGVSFGDAAAPGPGPSSEGRATLVGGCSASPRPRGEVGFGALLLALALGRLRRRRGPS